MWFIGNSTESFAKRIANETRCALGIVDFDLSRGLLQHVGMRGDAVVEAMDNDRLYHLLRRYLGDNRSNWNPAFQENVIERLDLMVRFEPRSVVMRDQSYFR